MDNARASAAERTFATPELLEHILSFLLQRLLPLTDQEDPRSVRVYGNAAILTHLLQCSEVGRAWHDCIQGSKPIQRALFFAPDTRTQRSWDHSAAARRIRLGSYFNAPSLRAPQLNPVIQTTFASYHFRFWHLSLETTGYKHCAYLIITRKDMPGISLRLRTGQGRSFSNMLLSQPPCTAVEAMVWEERDETKDYVDRTRALRDPVIRCDAGLTLGMVHERVAQMFDEHGDVTAIKLTTT